MLIPRPETPYLGVTYGAAVPSLLWRPAMTDKRPEDSPPPRSCDDPRLQRGGEEMEHAVVRERVIRLAFGGDQQRFEQFLSAIRESIPRDVSVVLRGSVVTGFRWADGQPFDADGPGTSDLDLTLVGGSMLDLFEDFYIPGVHSVPLSDEHPRASKVFTPLRRALSLLAERPVNIQATSDLVQYARDVLFGQPYHTLIEKVEADDPPDGKWERRHHARDPDA
jgi:hypothetical protein